MTSAAKKARTVSARISILAMTMLMFAMTGCASHRFSVAPAPDFSDRRAYGLPQSGVAVYAEADLDAIAPAAFEGIAANDRRNDGRSSAFEGAAYQSGCSIGDRFDNDMTLAYDFDDGQSRLGLDVDIDGLGISDIGNVEVTQIRVEFRYRFQPERPRKERCRYPSAFQGLVGSAYNEMFRREENTVWNELEDRGVAFWE